MVLGIYIHLPFNPPNKNLTPQTMSTFQIPKTQKAAVLHEPKGDYRIETNWPVTQPHELKPGQCLVKIECSGVCHSDLLVRNVGMAQPSIIPLIGGHEGVGVVVAIGENTQHPAVKIGDRVGVKWISGVCETCVYPAKLEFADCLTCAV